MPRMLALRVGRSKTIVLIVSSAISSMVLQRVIAYLERNLCENSQTKSSKREVSKETPSFYMGNKDWECRNVVTIVWGSARKPSVKIQWHRDVSSIEN